MEHERHTSQESTVLENLLKNIHPFVYYNTIQMGRW